MKSHVRGCIIIIIALFFLLFSYCISCSSIKKVSENSGQDEKIKSTVNIPTIEQTVTTLCSDEFEGRRTFSKGNEKAGEYIANIFKNIGLNTLYENSYYQKYTQEVSYLTEKEAKEASKNLENSYKTIYNVVGYINGTNSEKAVVISAHFDHIGIKDGNIYRGALDNASGVAALIEIAKKLKEVSSVKPFESNIIFCAFNGEEQLYFGSSAFIKQSKSKSWYKDMYNINIDCIGVKDGGKFTFVNDSKYSEKLYDAVKNTMNKNNINFIETKKIVGSDHRSFEYVKKPNVCISQENFREWANKPTDIPDILDYNQIGEIANALYDFIKISDGLVY